MDATVVRQGEPGDKEPAVGAWRAAEEARRAGRPAPRDRGQRVRGHVEGPTAFLFVAGSGGEVVGMAVGMQGRADDGAGPPIEDPCHVGAVFVRPDRWGEGVGGMLVDAVLAEARSRGNGRAHGLYTRRGFHRTGREKEDDSGETVVHHRREL
jgi:GNAT superfamily N-acetyltransferase